MTTAEQLVKEISDLQYELESLDQEPCPHYFDYTQWTQRKQDKKRRLQEMITGLTHKLRVSKSSDPYTPTSNPAMALVIQEFLQQEEEKQQEEDNTEEDDYDDVDDDDEHHPREEETEEDDSEGEDRLEDQESFQRRAASFRTKRYSTRSSLSLLSLPDSCSLVDSVADEMQQLIELIQESNDGIELLEKKKLKYKKYMKTKGLSKKKFLSCGKKIKQLDKTIAHETRVLHRLEDEFYACVE